LGTGSAKELPPADNHCFADFADNTEFVELLYAAALGSFCESIPINTVAQLQIG
jgi:hypothetical protein